MESNQTENNNVRGVEICDEVDMASFTPSTISFSKRFTHKFLCFFSLRDGVIFNGILQGIFHTFLFVFACIAFNVSLDMRDKQVEDLKDQKDNEIWNHLSQELNNRSIQQFFLLGQHNPIESFNSNQNIKRLLTAKIANDGYIYLIFNQIITHLVFIGLSGFSIRGAIQESRSLIELFCYGYTLTIVVTTIHALIYDCQDNIYMSIQSTGIILWNALTNKVTTVTWFAVIFLLIYVVFAAYGTVSTWLYLWELKERDRLNYLLEQEDMVMNQNESDNLKMKQYMKNIMQFPIYKFPMESFKNIAYKVSYMKYPDQNVSSKPIAV